MGDEMVKKVTKRALLLLNCVVLAIGNCGGPLITRLYFLRGGKRVWLSSWLETAGFPVILLPLCAAYVRRRAKEGHSSKVILMKRPLFMASAAIGLLTGVDDYLYAYGMSTLPVSTSSLIVATQLAFTAAFAFLLVRQRLTAYSTNAVVLLTLAAVVLGLRANGDKPAGETNRQYYTGFFMTILAAAVYGLILPLVELMYKKTKQALSYALVMEIQLVISLRHRLLHCRHANQQRLQGRSTIPAPALSSYFNSLPKCVQVMGREAREFELGETKYYMVVVWSAIIWQGFFMGAVGVIFCASSLFSAVFITVLLPVTEVLAVFFFQEKFRSEKAISLVLSLWGFASYFYGELKHKTPTKPDTEDTEIVPTGPPFP